jgi:hypothetical protein
VAPVLPHNVDAERSVLGAILLDNRYLIAAAERLRVDDFFLPQHRHIFEHMMRLDVEGQPVDPVTLAESLSKSGELEASGGVGYLSQIADGLPAVTNLAHYAAIVRTKASLRRIIYAAHQVEESCLGGGDPQAILEKAGSTFGEIRDSQSTDPVAPFDTWAEFQAAKPLHSLIENFLQADVCNIIGGLSGDGKTLILFSVTKALLTGEPLFGFFKVTSPLDRVVYLIPECARAPFFHRAKLFGLEKYIEDGRLLVRTLSKGPRINLNDARLLRVAKGSAIMVDTAARFSTGSENEAGDVAAGLATDIFGLLSAGAATVSCAHHSPKSYEKETYISLENCLRGSGDFGAFVGAGFGIRQIDEVQNVIHLEDVKARDANPLPPFQIIGRPFIDTEGDFRMHRLPNDCGKLSEYLDHSERNRGGASSATKQQRSSNIELMREWLKSFPHETSAEISARFKACGVSVSPETVRGYKREINK